MPFVARTGEALVRMGLGHAVARVATLVYNLKPGARRRFSFDEAGNWVNEQDGATFVSPGVHTLRYDEVRATTRDIWEFGYAPKPGDIVVDVGAGIGTETVPFAQAVGPTGRVVAIEAHPRTCEALRRTVVRSGLTNVTVVHAATADREGELRITDTDFHIGNTIVAATSGLPVRALTLDQLAREQGITRIDYLKMNIEGAEGLAIGGMAEMIGATTHIAIACHDFLAEEEGKSDETRTLASVRAFAKSHGFTTTERPNDARPWVRDQIYGARIA